MTREHNTATSQWWKAPSNDTPWGAEVDAQQDAEADAEWTPPRRCAVCRGDGMQYDGNEPCEHCNGTGEI